MSSEPDIAAVDLAIQSEEAATRISGALGQGSQFHSTYGYYCDGVERTTATFPPDWDQRLIRHQVNEDQHGASHAFFPEIHDLCISKLAAGRPQDHRFVAALVKARHVEAQILSARAERVTQWRPGEEARVREWLSNRSTHSRDGDE